MDGLVLSLFPGIGLLDMAFEEEGFCVVRGPDLLWGGDVLRFHPPAGKFDGVIGGPPCKAFSPMANVCRARYGEESIAPDMIPEFARVLREAAPRWWVMENVVRAYAPESGAHRVALNNRHVGGVQNRERVFYSNLRLAPFLETEALEPAEWEPAVCASVGGRRAKPIMGEDGRPIGNQSKARPGLRMRSVSEAASLQGLSADFLADAPFTERAKLVAIGNGVPLPMGRAIARAVKRALAVAE